MANNSNSNTVAIVTIVIIIFLAIAGYYFFMGQNTRTIETTIEGEPVTSVEVTVPEDAPPDGDATTTVN